MRYLKPCGTRSASLLPDCCYCRIVSVDSADGPWGPDHMPSGCACVVRALGVNLLCTAHCASGRPRYSFRQLSFAAGAELAVRHAVDARSGQCPFLLGWLLPHVPALTPAWPPPRPLSGGTSFVKTATRGALCSGVSGRTRAGYPGSGTGSCPGSCPRF